MRQFSTYQRNIDRMKPKLSRLLSKFFPAFFTRCCHNKSSRRQKRILSQQLVVDVRKAVKIESKDVITRPSSLLVFGDNFSSFTRCIQILCQQGHMKVVTESINSFWGILTLIPSKLVRQCSKLVTY